jgi:hypothetical protein
MHGARSSGKGRTCHLVAELLGDRRRRRRVSRTNFPFSLAPDLLTAAAKLDFDDIETVGFVHGYWEPERDGLGKPVLDLGRVRGKVKRVIAGADVETSDEPIDSECDA